MRFSVFLPPQAETQKVPVLYWLSGLTCTDENFVQKAGAQQFAARCGVALIAPDTSPRGDDVPDDPNEAYDFGLGAGFYLNATQSPWRENYRMYDYVSTELPSLVQAEFPVDASRSGIFGHSMGGHGALTIGLKNREQFRSISAFAPICAPIQCPWGQKALGTYLGDNQERWQEYDACALVKKGHANSADAPILIDQGLDDNFLGQQLKPELFQTACDEAETPLHLHLRKGYDHSYFFIASFIESHISFHIEQLSDS